MPLIAAESAYIRRLDAGFEQVAASGTSAALSPIADRLRQILEFHRQVVLPKMFGSSAHDLELFFDAHRNELASVYRSFFAVEVPESVVDLIDQLRPSLGVVDEQLAAYGLLFGAL